MNVNDSWIRQIATSILDGEHVDWNLGDRPDLEDESTVDCLRLIERLAAAHRDLSPTVDTPPAEQMWGHLRLVDVIGEGSFGRVYRAFDPLLDREVAIKLLSHSTELHHIAILEEGRLLARVRHPNVVTIYGADRFNGRTGLWMELIHGETLAERCARAETLEVRDVVRIGVELCRAVHAVHSAGLVHGDIKPHNVMSGSDGRIVLMDFGAGREFQNTACSDISGTPLYAAPELLQGERPTPQSDIYSLGVLLFYLLTGRHPVEAPTLAQLRAAHARRERWPMATFRHGVPSRMRRVIEQALEHEPSRRFQTAVALSRSLERGSGTWKPQIVGLAATVLMAAFWLRSDSGWLSTESLQSARTTSVAAARPVVAVLPFRNVSGEAESSYFVDGFTTDLIGALTRLNGVSVRSQTSSFAFKDRPRDLSEVARQLDATYVVEGTVARAGDRLRVAAQLVEVSTDHTLWVDRFERSVMDLFDIQDALARSIATRLELTISRGAAPNRVDVQTYDAYLRARLLLDRRGLGTDSAKAAELFRQVIQRDPSYAPAHAGLALAYAYMSLNPYPVTALSRDGNGLAFEDANAVMREAAAKALSLDPTLGEAHAAIGWLHAREFDWRKARESFHRAIALNPIATQTYTNFSYSTLRPLQLHSEAEQLLRTALVHDPLSIGVRRELAELLLQAGRAKEALAEFRRLAVDAPSASAPHAARALTHTGDVAGAIVRLESLGAGAAGWLADAYVKAGRRSDAERLARTHQPFPFRLAVIATALGDKEAAIQALVRMADSEPQRLALLMAQPELSSLKREPRLAALRARLRLS